LINSAYVYHKRRVNLKLFTKQIYVFGMSRITLYLLYPKSLKLVHMLPACFLLGVFAMLLLSILWNWMTILPLALYLVLLFITALVSTKRLKIALLSIVTSMIQLCGYGVGFIKAFTQKILFRQGRDVEEEILIRKGK
ncbi:MAG: glycosyl transferase family 2, partial [Bacteroidales bacterium]